MIKLTRQETCMPEASCLLPPPDFTNLVFCDPCDPCSDKVPPRTLAKDSICISPSERERCFRMSARQCDGSLTQYPAFLDCIQMRVRRKQLSRVVSVEEPIRATASGDMCYTWSCHFLALGPGYYEGDVYFNGKYSHTIGLHKNAASIVSHAAESVEAQPSCEEPQCGPCCGTVPQVEEEAPTPQTYDCEDC